MIKKLLKLPRIPFLWLIRLYQVTLSPDHGPLKFMFPHGFCIYEPTCSEYAYEVIEKKGLLIGVPRAIWRIIRCNPFSRGGHDPVTKQQDDKKSSH